MPMKQHLLGIGLAMALVGAAPNMPTPPKHLVPEASDFARLVPHDLEFDQGSHRLNVLRPALDKTVRVFMVGEPAFIVPQYVIGLKETAKGYRIFGASPKSMDQSGPLVRCEARLTWHWPGA